MVCDDLGLPVVEISSDEHDLTHRTSEIDGCRYRRMTATITNHLHLSRSKIGIAEVIVTNMPTTVIPTVESDILEVICIVVVVLNTVLKHIIRPHTEPVRTLHDGERRGEIRVGDIILREDESLVWSVFVAIVTCLLESLNDIAHIILLSSLRSTCIHIHNRSLRDVGVDVQMEHDLSLRRLRPLVYARGRAERQESCKSSIYDTA